MATAQDRFTRIYEEHYDAVERYVRRRADDAVVRDVVAEVFLVVWRRFDEVPAEPLPWLYGTAQRILANELRGSRRRTQLVARVAEHAATESDDHAEDVVGMVSVAAAMDRLSEPDQEALRLIAWEGLNLREAARAAGCSITAFAMRLHRARSRLRQEMTWTTPNPLVALRGEPT
jgi:RNA polymerase sigma-70 factor (ECF subfamily)